MLLLKILSLISTVGVGLRHKCSRLPQNETPSMIGIYFSTYFPLPAGAAQLSAGWMNNIWLLLLLLNPRPSACSITFRLRTFALFKFCVNLTNAQSILSSHRVIQCSTLECCYYWRLKNGLSGQPCLIPWCEPGTPVRLVTPGNSDNIRTGAVKDKSRLKDNVATQAWSLLKHFWLNLQYFPIR